MKRALKLLHVLGAIGMIGALAAHIVLLSTAPPPTSLAEYAIVRRGVAAIAETLLLPSLLVVLTSGLLALGVNRAYHDQGWALIKAALGVVSFEGTLVSVQGPAVEAAELATRAAAGEIEPPAPDALMHNEWGALWMVLAIALANVVLGVWRPRIRWPKAR